MRTRIAPPQPRARYEVRVPGCTAYSTARVTLRYARKMLRDANRICRAGHRLYRVMPDGERVEVLS